MPDGSLDLQYGMKGVQNDEYSGKQKAPWQAAVGSSPKGQRFGALVHTSPWMGVSWKRQFLVCSYVVYILTSAP